MSDEFDLVVIGAGSGGVRAARMASGHGARVAIIEERFFGGTCVNVGCVPKKLFAYGAGFPEEFELAASYGYQLDGWRFDWNTLRDNKTREIERLNGIYNRILDNAGVTVFEGHGRIEGPGRVPKLDGLFAEGVSVQTRDNGAVIVDDAFQTSEPGIHALGDVTDRLQLTPVALAEGMWLAAHLFGEHKPKAPLDYRDVPTAVFCHPNIGTVGLSQEEALAEYGTIRVYKSQFRPMRYTLSDIQEKSMMKLIVDDASDRVVGLHMAGEESAEITQGFAVAVRMGATKADFDATVGIHPTSAEELVTLRDGETVSG